MKKRAVAAILLSAAALTIASVQLPAAATQSRGGRAVSVTPVADLNRSQVTEILAGVPFENVEARHGVRAYRIEYRTLDVRRRPTTASALLAIPADPPKIADTVVWEHGTRAARADVASVSDDNLDRPAALLFAADGYVTVAPDYLGLGTGPGPHPYVHAETEARASLDAVRAAHEIVTGWGRRLSGDVFVSGFSQGGHAAMALGAAMLCHYPSLDYRSAELCLRLRALAPISGPFDLAGTEIPGLFDGRIDPIAGNFYISYFTLSMNRTYGLFRSPSEVFRAPYDRTLPPLFDGNHDEMAIVPALPSSLTDLLTPGYAARLRHPDGALRRAIDENDRTCRWNLRVPVRLYAASGDREVPIGNTEQCVKQLSAAGARITVVDLGDVEHLVTPILALPDVLRWFDHL